MAIKNIVQLVKIIYVYGPGQRGESIIPMNRKIKNKKINVNFPNINDYIYIDDVVKIINYFLIDSIKTGIYNLGTGRGIEVKNLVKIIDYKIYGKYTLTKEYSSLFDSNKRNQNFYSCTKKINKFLNNYKFTDIDSGINNLI